MKLGEPTFCDIDIKLFSVTLDGVTFSLDYESGVEEDGDSYEYVMFWPMDVMFHPPWDSGDFST